MRGAKILLIFTGFLLFAIPATGQKKKPGDQLTKEEIENLTKAEYFFDEKIYIRALPLFLKLSKDHPSDAYFKFRTGICYLYKSDEKESSLPFLVAADSLDPTLEDLQYFLGRAYHLNYKFDDAISILNDYIRKNPKSKFVKIASRYVEHSNNGKILVNENFEVEVEINNIGPVINSPAGEYVPVVSADQSVMIFTYRGEKSTGGLMDLKFKPDPESGEYYEDVFISKIVEKKWTTPQPIGTAINTKMHDAAIAISPDGQKLFIYKSTAKDKGDIYMSSLSGTEWGAPVKLGTTVNTKYWEGSVSVTADNQLLYFASERPGGLGGRDIYKSKKLANGEWGPAENLGPSINTPYNDDAPFIHPDGITLFFSTEGHNSIGGYDVLYSVWKNNAWVQPNNLGYPINTTEDDIYYVLSADGETGYYASNRKGGFGQQDIYTINPGFMGEKPVLALVFGIVSVDNKPVNATINVTDQQTGENVGTYQSNSSTGKYIVALTPGTDYKVAFEFEGMQPHIEYVDIKKLDTYVQVQQDIKLSPLGKPLAVQDSTNTLQKKFEKQIAKYNEESRPEVCMERVYKILLEKYGMIEYASADYRVELGTFESAQDFRSGRVKDLGTIESFKDVFNNTTFYFGGIKTLGDANKLLKTIETKDTTLVLQITIMDKGIRKLLPEYYDKEYKLEGCKPSVETPIITKGTIKGMDDAQYKDLVKSDGTKEVEGLTFKVEIASVTDTNDYKMQRFEKYGKIEKRKYPDGRWRYSFGPFKTLKEAEDFKKMLISKEPDAEKSIITVFVFGERKELDEYLRGPCNATPRDFSWFVGKDLNDVTVYKKLITLGGNYCADGLIFKVQIGAYRFPKNFKYPTVEEFGPAEIIDYPDGITRFTMRTFKTLQDAEVFRQVVIGRGITDAWITAVYNGQRILLDELIKVNFYGKSVN